MEKALEQRPLSERGERGVKKFEYYQKDFHLSEEQLKAPILDVGAGEGGFVDHLREQYGNENAWGVDYSQRRAAASEGQVVNASGLALPFESGVFHTVTAHDYLPMFVDHPEQLAQAIAEPLRVLEDGGSFYGNTATPREEAVSALEIANDPDLVRSLPSSLERFSGSLLIPQIMSGFCPNGISLELEKSETGKTVAHFQKDGEGKFQYSPEVAEDMFIHQERLHALTLPLSTAGENLLNKLHAREPLTIKEKIDSGRDSVFVGREIPGIVFKPDHAYRMIDEATLEKYMREDSIEGEHATPDIFTHEGEVANAGVDWYLGGACPRYGNIVIETPADMRKFVIADKDKNMMAKNPFVRHIKSQGGTELAIPLSDTHAYRLVKNEDDKHIAEQIY